MTATPTAGESRPDPEREPEREPEAPGRGLLTVRLGEARFGIWVDEALEVVPTPPISRLPLAAAEVPGVTSVRGDIVPVLDLGLRLLGTPAVRPGRLVLVRHEDSGTIVGLLVDAVERLVPVHQEELCAPPDAEDALPPELVEGVVTDEADVIAVLRLGQATAPPEPSTDEG